MKKVLAVLAVPFLLVGCATQTKNLNKSKMSFNGHSTDELFSLVSSRYIDEGVDVPTSSILKGEKGVLFNVSPNGSSITYTNLVDLREVDGDLIKFFANITEKSFNMTSITVSVIDAYDPNNYFSVYWVQNGGVVSGTYANKPELWPSSGCMNTFVSVMYRGEKLAVPNFDPPNYPDNVVAWDQCFYCYEKMSNFVPLSFGFDNETNVVDIEIKKDQRITLYDLDDPTDGVDDFAGFKTGEVYLKIETNGTGGSLLVNKIGNDSLSTLSTNLFKKNTGNLLVYGGIADHEIIGAINNKMPLPNIEMSNAQVNVDLKMGTEEIQLPEINNFYPNKDGDYVLNLSSDNKFGEKITKSYPFRVNKTPTDIVEIDPTNPSVKIRETNYTPNYFYTGGNGKLTYLYTLNNCGEYSEVKPGDPYVIQKKNISSDITVTVFDEIGQVKSFTHPISVDYNYFYFHLLDSFESLSVIKGSKFKVPSYTAIDYSKEGDCLVNNVPVTIKQGLYTILNVGDEIEINNDTNLYFYNGVNLIKTIKIHAAPNNVTLDKDATKLIKQYGELNSISELTTNNLGTSFIVDDKDASFVHPYALSATKLKIEFALLDDHSFESVTFVLNSLSGKSLVFKVEELGEKPVLYVNGAKTNVNITATRETYLDSDDQEMRFAAYFNYCFVFDAAYKNISNKNGRNLLSVESWSNGDAFDFFEKGCCQLSVILAGGKAKDRFILESLSNQGFGTNAFKYGDYTGPCVSFEQVLATTSVELNSSLVIPKAYAYDVFDNNSTIEMTLYNTDGSKMFGPIDPIEYVINFTNYGQYTVEYRAEDSKGRAASPSYSFYVDDKIAPEISINGTYQAAYYNSVTVLSASVIDNFDNNPKLNIWLVDEGTRYTSVKAGDVLTLKEGKYFIIYNATDNSGNSSYVRFDFYIVKR